MKIAIYVDRNRFEQGIGDTPYLYEATRTEFDVTLHWEADADLCADADVVFYRFTRTEPTPVAFLRRLARYRDKLIVNDPSALLRHGGKRHLLLFPDLTVPTLISGSIRSLMAFAREHDTIVLKPVESSGGRGTVKLVTSELDDRGLQQAVREHVDEYGTLVAQLYIDSVTCWGDKRINMVAYRPISAVRTLPADGSFICHRSLGGREVAATITPEDASILEQITPFLKENRIWWAGIDLIGPYLGEVNILSPMMIQRADVANGNTDGMDALVASLHAFRISNGL